MRTLPVMPKNMDSFELKFTLAADETQLRAENGDKIVLEAVLLGEELAVSMWYDFDERPLTLRGAANPGDDILFRLLPYRLELWVNGVCVDEEWPCGSHFLSGAVFTTAGEAEISPYKEPEEPQPEVLFTFENAEGWRPGGNVFVGDCMPHSFEGRYHVLYLKDRHHHQSKWGRGAHQWEHISTEDFVHWQHHPMAVAIDDPTEGSICTGSWICRDGVHYLFYTVRKCDGSPATICRSISKDGYHFTKDKGYAFTLSDKYHTPSARDPKITKGADGLYHMFLTTSLVKENLGCLAHLVSEDMDVWKELDDPVYIAPTDYQPECSDTFELNGWHYLVFDGKYVYSKHPYGPWTLPKEPKIPCGSVPKAAFWKDRLIFTGFYAPTCYAGTMMFMEAVPGENGELIFKKM